MANLGTHILLAAEKRLGSIASPEIGLQRVAMLINGLLIIALARVIAGLTVTLLWGQPLLPVGATAVAAQGLGNDVSKSIQGADFATIGGWHFFGRMEATPVVEAQPAPTPVTPLNLRLVGVFLTEQRADRALALIAEGTGVERSYRVGESLPGGARLDQVQRNSVVVSRNGQQEVLNLPRLDEGRRTASADMSTALPIQPELPMQPEMPPEPEMPVPVEQPEMPPPPVLPSSFHQPQMIDATSVASKLRGATGGPGALEDIAFASPYVRDGQFVGFRLRPGRDRQLMEKLGLSSGDVITEVNGSRLNNPMQGFTALRELMDAEQVNVRVLRNGAEIPLAFSLSGTGLK